MSNSLFIKQIKDDNDTRKKNLFLEKDGKKFFDIIYNSQKKRIFNALKNSEPDSVVKFKKVWPKKSYADQPRSPKTLNGPDLHLG